MKQDSERNISLNPEELKRAKKRGKPKQIKETGIEKPPLPDNYLNIRSNYKQNITLTHKKEKTKQDSERNVSLNHKQVKIG